MTFILGLLAVTAVFSSLLLTFVILLQEPKGGGIASALGGSGMEALGVATGGVNRFTCWVAGVWIAACLLHAILQGPSSNLRDIEPEKPAPTSTNNGGGEKAPDVPQPPKDQQTPPGDK